MEDKKAPEFVLVPVGLMNDLLAYLGTKPFTEVAPYINAIQRDSKFVDPPATPAQVEIESKPQEEAK